MHEPQLYYPSSTKNLFVSAHDFYVEQMKKRIFSQFDDLEGRLKEGGGGIPQPRPSLP
jgi:hypothetical protein